MADPLPVYAEPLTGPPSAALPWLADLATAQPPATAIAAFLLLYALLTLTLRLADRIDPPPERLHPAKGTEPPQPRVWRFRRTA